MKRIPLVIIFFFMMAAAAWGQPVIVFDAESHDFGKVSSFTAEHTFEFTNTGDEELVIEKIHSS